MKRGRIEVLIIVIILLLILVCFSLFYYFNERLSKKETSSGVVFIGPPATCGNGVCESGENSTSCREDCLVSCSSNSDCEDGYDITSDVCINPGTTDARCEHQAKRAISECYGFGLISLNEWNQSGILDKCNVISGFLTLSNPVNLSFFNYLRNKGKIFTAQVELLRYYSLTNAQIDANKERYIQEIYRYFSQKFSDGFDAISFDEMMPQAHPSLMSAVSIAIERLKKKLPK